MVSSISTNSFFYGRALLGNGDISDETNCFLQILLILIELILIYI